MQIQDQPQAHAGEIDITAKPSQTLYQPEPNQAHSAINCTSFQQLKHTWVFLPYSIWKLVCEFLFLTCTTGITWKWFTGLHFALIVLHFDNLKMFYSFGFLWLICWASGKAVQRKFENLDKIIYEMRRCIGRVCTLLRQINQLIPLIDSF